jgi:hypothetical protein
VGAVQGASCFGPAYEFATIMDTDLKKRGIRDKCPITFVTPEPYIGHLGLGGVGDSKGLLESECRHRHIKWHTNSKVDKVEADKVIISECDDNGEAVKTVEIDSKYTMLLPAFKGVDTVANLANVASGFVNPRGFVMVNEYQNIFLISRLRVACFHITNKKLLKGDFRQVHHLAFFRPSNISRWDLRHGNKGCACITHISNTNCIPSWDV